MMLEILENWTKFNSVVPQGTLTIAPKTGILIPGANFERLYEAKISKSGQMEKYTPNFTCNDARNTTVLGWIQFSGSPGHCKNWAKTAILETKLAQIRPKMDFFSKFLNLPKNIIKCYPKTYKMSLILQILSDRWTDGDFERLAQLDIENCLKNVVSHKYFVLIFVFLDSSWNSGLEKWYNTYI